MKRKDHQSPKGSAKGGRVWRNEALLLIPKGVLFNTFVYSHSSEKWLSSGVLLILAKDLEFRWKPSSETQITKKVLRIPRCGEGGEK